MDNFILLSTTCMINIAADILKNFVIPFIDILRFANIIYKIPLNTILNSVYRPL